VTLAREVMKHPVLREMVATKEVTIPWRGHPEGRALLNHNHLLWLTPAVTGVKTGFTDAAGQCIVVYASDKGVNLMLSYMGGPSLAQRDQEVMALLQYGFDSYQQRKVIAGGEAYADVGVPYDWGRTMPLVADGDLVEQVYVRDEIEYRTVLPEDMSLPVHRGDKVGLVEAYEGDIFLGSCYLLATEDVPEPGLLGRINYLLESVYHFLLFTAAGR
jgi:D-alanyl-D-alanine carboxypeptidase (penicillin-binding protein 5/6)